jgi:hypothetical protein
MADALIQLRDVPRVFAAECDWDPFHSPRNLATALAAEAAELLRPFQWLTDVLRRSSRRSARAAASLWHNGPARTRGG